MGANTALLSEDEIDRRLRLGDTLMTAREIADLMGTNPPTAEEWVRRNWPDRLELGPRKVRWWRSDVIRQLAKAQRP